MNEPRIRYEETRIADRVGIDRKAVRVMLPVDWAHVLYRQQQLLNDNESGVSLRIFRDENGCVRVRPE